MSLKNFYSMHICFASMYVCVPHVCPVPMSPEEGTRSPIPGVTGSCGPPCGCWELNPGSLKEQLLKIIYILFYVHCILPACLSV